MNPSRRIKTKILMTRKTSNEGMLYLLRGKGTIPRAIFIFNKPSPLVQYTSLNLCYTTLSIFSIRSPATAPPSYFQYIRSPKRTSTYWSGWLSRKTILRFFSCV